MNIKDAKAGERWTTGLLEGVVVELSGKLYMAVDRNGMPDIWPIAHCFGVLWTKTHNADGTPYKQLLEHDEHWAARDEDGCTCLHVRDPEVGTRGHISTNPTMNLGHISFRPELPWDQTACRVRVRLEVAE